METICIRTQIIGVPFVYGTLGVYAYRAVKEYV